MTTLDPGKYPKRKLRRRGRNLGPYFIRNPDYKRETPEEANARRMARSEELRGQVTIRMYFRIFDVEAQHFEHLSKESLTFNVAKAAFVGPLLEDLARFIATWKPRPKEDVHVPAGL